MEDWHEHYNEYRLHSAIEYNVPIAMHYPDGVTSPSSLNGPKQHLAITG
jgi:putative transposase